MNTLFETICLNAKYNLNRTTLTEKKKKFKEKSSSFNKRYWAFVESLTPSFLCPISVIEKHIGEEYDFNIHINPLIDAGYIWIRKWTNCFPHSKELAEESKKSHGLCKDYQSGIVYLEFYLGSEDPNKNHKFEDAWL